MRGFIFALKRSWLWMLVPPWRRIYGRTGYGRASYRWTFWLMGWAWTVIGVIGGALVASSIVQGMGIAGLGYRDWLVIGVAVVTGFVVQLVGWCLVALITASLVRFLPRLATRSILYTPGANVGWMPTQVPAKRRVVYYALLGLLPLAGVGYALYRYLTWVGVSQHIFSIALVGAVLVKAFLIPLIKALVTGALFRWFLRWLRGEKAKPSGA